MSRFAVKPEDEAVTRDLTQEKPVEITFLEHYMVNKQKNSVASPGTSKTEVLQEDVWIPAVCHLQCVDQACSMKVHRVNGIAVGD